MFLLIREERRQSMIITRPDYLTNFRCSATNCEDNCCEKWGIVIDDATIKKYKNVKGDFGKRLKKSIDFKDNTFHQENKRCVFLNDSNLCDIHKCLGYEYLCKTCRRYPRHVEEFENVREWSLSLSCKEVCDIILSRKDRVRFISKTKEVKEETFQDFDNLLYDKLVTSREYLFELVNDANKNFKEKLCTLLAFGHDLQRRIDKNNIFDIDNLVETFNKNKEAKRFKEKLGKYKTDDSIANISQLFDSLYKLEVLNFEWRDFTDRVREALYEESPGNYDKASKDFCEFEKDFEYEYMQLLTYFIYTYFCGSVYDGESFAKIKMAVVSTILIREMYKGVWKMNGGALSFDERKNIVYLFSRELEHSDDNLKLFENICENAQNFKLSPMLLAISQL